MFKNLQPNRLAGVCCILFLLIMNPFNAQQCRREYKWVQPWCSSSTLLSIERIHTQEKENTPGMKIKRIHSLVKSKCKVEKNLGQALSAQVGAVSKMFAPSASFYFLVWLLVRLMIFVAGCFFCFGTRGFMTVAMHCLHDFMTVTVLQLLTPKVLSSEGDRKGMYCLLV